MDAAEQDDTTSSLHRRVAAFALSLRDRHGSRCETLEEDHLNQAIEQEVGVARGDMIEGQLLILRTALCYSCLLQVFVRVRWF